MDDYSFDDGSDSSDSNSSGGAIADIINAAGSLGTTALLATQAPQVLAPNSFVPGFGNAAPALANAQYGASVATQASKNQTYIILGVLVVAGALAFHALK